MTEGFYGVVHEMRRLILISFLFLAGMVLFLLTLVAFFPAKPVEAWIRDTLKSNGGIVLADGRFYRIPPFGLGVEGLSLLLDDRGRRFDMDRADVFFKPFGILSGELRFGIEARLGDGEIVGETALGLGRMSIDTTIRHMDIEVFPFPEGSGIDGTIYMDGRIDIDHDGRCASGTVEMEDNALNARGIRWKGLRLPTGTIEDIGMMIELYGCKASVKGFWIKAENLSARIKGEIGLERVPLEKNPIALTIEIITKDRDPAMDLLMRSLLARYRRSANYYTIPVSGTLEMPVIGR